MSNDLFAIRKLEFPAAPPTGITLRKTCLLYRLPYTTSLLLNDDTSSAIVTKTFKPGDLTLLNDILDTNPKSTGYNPHKIQEYINKNIFSQVVISSVSGSEGAPSTPSIYNITSLHRMIDLASEDTYTIINNPFMRDDKIYWIEAFNEHEFNTLTLAIKTYDTANDTLSTFNSISFTSTSMTNPVIDSNGNAFILTQHYINDGYSIFLSTPGESIDTTVNSTLITISTNSKPETLLIDSNDTLYFTISDGIFRINPDYTTTQIASGDCKYAIYNIFSDTILAYYPGGDSAGRIREIALTGDILRTQEQIVGYSFGMSDQIEAVFDGYSMLTGVSFGETSTFTSIPTHEQRTIGTGDINLFTDGGTGIGEISKFYTFVIPYDISAHEIYFIDNISVKLPLSATWDCPSTVDTSGYQGHTDYGYTQSFTVTIVSDPVGASTAWSMTSEVPINEGLVTLSADSASCTVTITQYDGISVGSGNLLVLKCIVTLDDETITLEQEVFPSSP